MEANLRDFVHKCKQLAKQALGKHAGEHATGGFARWKHVVLHCIRLEDNYTYRELIDRLSLMGTICEVVDLDPGDLLDPSAVCKAFDRFKMWVWRQLLRAAAQQLPTSGHASIDGTYFERTQPSYHYRWRSDRTIETLKATVLVDSHTKTVLDVQPTATWRHDTAVGPQVARRNAGDLLSLAADKGYDKNAFREWLRNYDIRPLIRHCLYAAYDYAHNARIDDDLYNQRWLTETCFSVVKRSHGRAVRAQTWYREFRECVLMFVIYNTERASSALWPRRRSPIQQSRTSKARAKPSFSLCTRGGD